MVKRNRSGGLVYATEHGRMCPRCGQPRGNCRCHKADTPIPADGIVRLGRETKGRKGKGVTTISGIPLGADDLRAYVSALKKKCGSGGAIKQGVVEIQGDHRDLLLQELQKQGWTVKRSGA